MTALSCADVEPLLDLYAADECDPATRDLVRAHLAECGSCRASLAEARQVAGLLDVHFGQPAALGRLRRAVQRENRPLLLRPASAARFGSLAALLLVCLGLGLGVVPATLGGPSLTLALVEADAVPAVPARGGAERLQPPQGKKEGASLVVSLGGSAARRWRTDIQAEVPPLPPRVDLEFVVHNTGREPVRVGLGARPAVLVDLVGPKVVRRAAPAGVPSPLSWPGGTVPPGGKAVVRYPRLVSLSGGRMEYVYPVTPGDYRLTVRVRFTVSTPSRGERAVWLTPGNPVTLAVPGGT